MELKSAGTSIIDPRISLELEDEREILDRRLNDITGESSRNLKHLVRHILQYTTLCAGGWCNLTNENGTNERFFSFRSRDEE